MSMIKCPECQHDMSDSAISCPNCGYVLKRSDYEDDNLLRNAFGIKKSGVTFGDVVRIVVAMIIFGISSFRFFVIFFS